MQMFSKDSKWSYVINLSNGIIGVSVLTMPFCLEQCGVVLGILLLLATNLLTRLTCQILVKAAYVVRRRSYEQLAFHTFGRFGKTFVEVCMILYTKSTLVAFFVVIGDLGPSVFADMFGLPRENETFHVIVMLAVGLLVIMPLSLLKSLDSLSHISSLAMLFYGFLVFRLFAACASNLLSAKMWSEINLWRMEGVLQCLPIFAMSLSCQTQLFVISNEIPDSSPAKMDAIVGGAVDLCSFVYISVGFFGYAAFYDKSISGDILVLLDGNALTQFIKTGFLLSVAVSYPLMIFPCRAAIYSMLYKREVQAPGVITLHDVSIDTMQIPASPLKVITAFLILFNLFVAIVIPNMELILGLSGSLIGSIICFIVPAVLFLTVAPPNSGLLRLASQFCIIVGVFMLFCCTYATFRHHQYVPHPVEDLNVDVNLSEQRTHFDSITFAPKIGIDTTVAKVKVELEREARKLVEDLKEQREEQKEILKEQKNLLEQMRKLSLNLSNVDASALDVQQKAATASRIQKKSSEKLIISTDDLVVKREVRHLRIELNSLSALMNDTSA